MKHCKYKLYHVLFIYVIHIILFCSSQKLLTSSMKLTVLLGIIPSLMVYMVTLQVTCCHTFWWTWFAGLEILISKQWHNVLELFWWTVSLESSVNLFIPFDRFVMFDFHGFKHLYHWCNKCYSLHLYFFKWCIIIFLYITCTMLECLVQIIPLWIQHEFGI